MGGDPARGSAGWLAELVTWCETEKERESWSWCWCWCCVCACEKLVEGEGGSC